MKVSINIASEYSNVDLKSIPANFMLQKIGSQLGAVEEVVYWEPKYRGIKVVKIVECAKHPNADKLHVCMIDDGGSVKNIKRDSKGLVQVVCGAPNVKKGMYAVWIPPRAVVPATKGTENEFILEARELRGIISNGMLASASELAINDDHSGILELDEESIDKKIQIGEDLTSLLALDDVVIDCENKMFTHRPDCFGILGVSRELAGINGLNFKSPDWYLSAVVNKQISKLKFISKNEIEDVVPRFMAQVIEGVKVKKSSLAMQIKLAVTGYRSLNNIVDYTNYFMHLTAQPTHAFDYDKIKALSGGTATIFPRMAKEGEELKLINGKIIKLTKEDIVIATDKKAVALAGIMGGSDTEVDENTKNIIIECATFDMYAVRKTSMRHGIFSDALNRFNKGQSSLQNDKVLAKLVHEINKENNSKAGILVDIASRSAKLKPKTVELEVQFVNDRLGRVFEIDELADLLERTEFRVEIQNNKVIVSPPFWRKDIHLKEDLVEEIGRLYGYDQLPTNLPTRRTTVIHKNLSYSFKRRIANTLKAFGCNEFLTYSFVHDNLLTNTCQDIKNAYQLRNAISPDLQYYRLSITPSLLSHIRPNQRSGYEEFAIFEIGQTHNKKYGLNTEGVPIEIPTLAFVYSASEKISKNKKGAAYYSAQLYLAKLLDEFNIKYKLEEMHGSEDLFMPFDPNRSAIIKSENNDLLGVLGEYKAVVRDKLKIPIFTSGFELNIDSIMQHTKNQQYEMISRYPSTTQDITVKVPYGIPYSNVSKSFELALGEEYRLNKYKISFEIIDIYGVDSNSKNYTFRIHISHMDKTLVTGEVNDLTSRLTEKMKKDCGAVRV